MESVYGKRICTKSTAGTTLGDEKTNISVKGQEQDKDPCFPRCYSALYQTFPPEKLDKKNNF